MKKIMVSLLIMAMVMVPVSAFSGGIWGMIKNTGLDKLQSKPYVIEVQGVNIRAYVFEIKEMRSVCVSVWGDSSQSLHCKTYKEIGIEKEIKKGE